MMTGKTFGNDTLGFVRARRRNIKGGHPSSRAYRAREGYLATSSASFVLLRAVRVNGKPRHEFVLGLGSQKNIEVHGVARFWVRAVSRMIEHGLSADQRKRLVAEMVRKGARLPSERECRESAENRFRLVEVAEVISHVKAHKRKSK